MILLPESKLDWQGGKALKATKGFMSHSLVNQMPPFLFASKPVADLGEGARGPGPPPFGGSFAKDLQENDLNEHSKAILKDFGPPLSSIL